MQDQCVAEAGEWIGDDKDLWQVWREMRGVEECITAEADLLAGKSVLVLSDAIGAVKYINDGTGQSVEMTAIMKRVFRLCVQKEISLRAEHLSGDKMKESGVDSLSRWGEFEVNAGVFKSFNQHSGWAQKCSPLSLKSYFHTEAISTPSRRFPKKHSPYCDMGWRNTRARCF